jgi:hypothetical protein
MRRYPALTAAAVPANDRHCLCIRKTRSRIQRPQAAPVRKQAPPAQTCYRYVQCDSATRLESRPPKTRPRAAAHERFLQTRVLAPLSISSDATPEPQSPRKMFLVQTAARTRLPARPPHSPRDSAAQFRQKKRGYTPGSSLAPLVFATPLSPHPVPRQFLERAHPTPFRTKSTEANASASCSARRMKRKTSSRTGSQKHVHSAAQEKTPPRISEREHFAGNARAVAKAIPRHRFSRFDYCRLADTLAIASN